MRRRYRIGYYTESGRYKPEYPHTYEPLMLYVRRLELETGHLSPEEREAWVRYELRPRPELFAYKYRLKQRGEIKQLKPTFEEFMEQRYNHLKKAA